MGTPSKGRRVNATVLYPTMVITQEEFRRLTVPPPPPPPEGNGAQTAAAPKQT